MWNIWETQKTRAKHPEERSKEWERSEEEAERGEKEVKNVKKNHCFTWNNGRWMKTMPKPLLKVVDGIITEAKSNRSNVSRETLENEAFLLIWCPLDRQIRQDWRLLLQKTLFHVKHWAFNWLLCEKNKRKQSKKAKNNGDRRYNKKSTAFEEKHQLKNFICARTKNRAKAWKRKKRKLLKICFSARCYFLWKIFRKRWKNHKKRWKRVKIGQKNTQNRAKKRNILRKKVLSKWEWNRAVGWNEKLKWKPKWSVLRYILCFFAVFGCFFGVFLVICRWIFLSAVARASSFFALCELMSVCYVLFADVFCKTFLRRGFVGFFFWKNDLFCDFFDEKSTFAADLTKFKKTCFWKNNGFSLYMVKYGNNYICSGYLCLFFCCFWIFGL